MDRETETNRDGGLFCRIQSDRGARGARRGPLLMKKYASGGRAKYRFADPGI
jgi:hypothetical protein